MNVMQLPGADLTYGAVPEAPHADKAFFGLHLHLAGKYYKNPKVHGGPTQCKSGPGNNLVRRRNNLLYIFQ